MWRSFLFCSVLLPSLIAGAAAGTAAQTAVQTAPLSPTQGHSAPHRSAEAAQFHSSTQGASSCPVGFTVARQASTELLRAGDRAHPDGMGIRISLEPAPGQEIRSADLVVHAAIGGPGVLPLNRTSDSRSDRTFHLEHAAAGALERSLLLDRVNGVTSADLIALRFADGSIWHAGAGGPCRAVPSLYLPVAASH